jgi:hypothetical protein
MLNSFQHQRLPKTPLGSGPERIRGGSLIVACPNIVRVRDFCGTLRTFVGLTPNCIQEWKIASPGPAWTSTSIPERIAWRRVGSVSSWEREGPSGPPRPGPPRFTSSARRSNLPKSYANRRNSRRSTRAWLRLSVPETSMRVQVNSSRPRVSMALTQSCAFRSSPRSVQSVHRSLSTE